MQQQLENAGLTRKPLMIWFDCTSNLRHCEHRTQAEKLFQVALMQPNEAAQDIGRLKPQVLCFDFDYPDQARLRVMQSIKQAHMSLPVLMLTVEHSEALAVWAFRARVWNYMVKPVDPGELLENFRALVRIAGTQRRGGHAFTLPMAAVPNQIPSRSSEDTQSLLSPAIYFIEQHFNERLVAEELAQRCDMDRFRFSRLFHRAFGVTFQEYLLRYRVRQACALLQRPRASITDVAYSVGFNDASYFSRIFKRYMNVLPSQYAAGKKEQHMSVSSEDPESAAIAVSSL